ncbi:cutinase family protein [Mycobacterium hubeiense]|uniref:cutinase family protein n=1 Tax=Mycobacterium hubeiense TaxID=1867256 RepID=UPI000C7F69DB|nr:cutinase family protein [Mycobacterium sp. QGD 101]
MLSRLGALSSAIAIGSALFGLTTGIAHADPSCPDVHWIGAAGSGERGPEATLNGGMGRVVYQSYNAVKELVERDGRTITAEAVEYPATEVPEDGGVLDWANFMSSVDAGTAALGGQYAGFTQRCPATKVVLAGYSQGAMVVHRNLHALGAHPNLAASLLIADGDRLPADPTVNIGSVTSVPGRGKGVAQDWPILAHAPAPLPPAIGGKTISVCDLGDVVCDYREESEETEAVMATAVAIHTGYDVTTRAGQAWTSQLHQLLGPAPAARELVLAGADGTPAE